MMLKQSAEIAVRRWCTRWNIEQPTINKNPNIDYMAYYEDGVIGISKTIRDPRIRYYIVLHELRHHYQALMYPDVFSFWMERKQVYDFFYHTALCNIEEDANLFAWSDGKENGEALLKHSSMTAYLYGLYKDIHNGKKTLGQGVSYMNSLKDRYGLSDWRAKKENITQITERLHF